MYVHNYVPDPLEVPGNITEEPYAERLAFIRRVTALHAISVCAIAGVTLAPIKVLPVSLASAYVLLLLLTLCLLRIVFRGTKTEAMSSLGLLPIVIVIFGMASASWLRAGFPVWAACIGLACGLTYTMLCGRDFSFVGQFSLSLIASSAIVSIGAIVLSLDPMHAAKALAWNACYLLFYVYDLASLLARRRRGEELAAVVDLYRDVLNVFGWVVRVIAHWRKHRIWTLPPRWS